MLKSGSLARGGHNSACVGRFPVQVSVRGRLLMWLAAGYFDESDDNERAFSVGGFIGHQHDCVHLQWAWEEKLLKKYGLEYFKASELEYGTGQFAKFRDDPDNLGARFSEREKQLFRQIKIDSVDVFLNFNLLISLGTVLMLPDYHRLFEEYKRLDKIIPAPYFFCAQLVMMESGFLMNEICQRHRISRGAIRPVFDQHEEYQGRAKQMFDNFKEKNPLCSARLLAPHYENSKDYIVLQAADNLAYEMRRLLITTEYDTHIPERIAMRRLKKHMAIIYKLDYEAMKVIMESQQPDQIPIKPEISNPGRRVL